MTETINLHGYATITLDRESRTIRGEITKYGTSTSDSRNIVIHNGAARVPTELSRVKLLVDHDARQPVGYMTEIDSAGATAAFKIATGSAGDQALADAENKLRDGLSVGMRIPDEPGASHFDADSNTFHVHTFDLVEVSLVAFPAFTDARVTSVAAAAEHTTTTPKEHQMPDTTTEAETAPTLNRGDLDAALSASNTELLRTVETRLAQANFGNHAAGHPATKFAGFGDFIKAFYAGDADAISLAKSRMGVVRLDAEGGAPAAPAPSNTGDTATPSTWVSDAIHFVNVRRTVLSAFTQATLPETGMTLEYLQLDSDSIVIEEQAAEGDELAFGKVSLKSSTTPVSTDGGYTKLTRQTVERANTAYLNTVGTAMDLAYARRTEARARQLLTAVIAAQTTANKTVTLVKDPDLFAWLDVLVDAAELFDDNGFVFDSAFVSKDVFKQLQRLEDSNGNALMNVYGQGVNQAGNIDFKGLTGKLGSLTFKLFPKASAKTMAFYDPLGLTFWESAGAPWTLQDDNTIDLTRSVSKYGYTAAASQYPDAIVPVKFAS